MGNNRSSESRTSPLVWLIYGCSALALATPLLISRIPSLPVTFIQTLAFEGLIEIVFVSWLALALTDRRFRPSRNIVLIAVLAFAAVTVISLLFAPDPSMSFWSRIWRMSGVWWSLHMAAWFVALHSSLRTREDWRQMLGLSCIIAGIAFFIAFTRWLRLPTTTTMGGTLGNPSHMAAYLLPHVFIAAYLSIGKSGLLRKLLVLASIAFSVGVVMTGSRGGFVALGFGLLLGFILLFLSSSAGKRTKISVLVALALFVLAMLAGVLALRSSSLEGWGRTRLPSFAQRLIYRDFGGDRWFLWEYALRGAAERPLFGWGNEGFAYLYDHYYDPQTEARDVFYERWQDRAHNRYLDILVAYGGVGLAAYLFLWGAVLATVFRGHIRKSEGHDRARGLILLTALMTVAVYDLFMLETLAQAAVVYLMFGLVAARPSSDEGEPSERAAWHGPFRAVILLAGFILAIVATVMPYIRGLQFDEGGRLISRDPQQAAEVFDMAFSWPNPYREEMIYGGVYTTLLAEGEMPISSLEPLVRLLTRHSRAAADSSPLSTRETMMMSQMSRLLAYYDPAALDDAVVYAERLRDMAPGKFDGYFELARAELFAGDYDVALENLELAADRVYLPRKEFAYLVRVHKAATYAALRNYEQSFRELAALSEAKYKLADEPLPVIMMGRTLQPGTVLPDALVKYAIDVANARKQSLRTGLAAARIMASAGRVDDALAMLDRLSKERPDGRSDIEALRQETISMTEGYVEEAETE